MAMPLSNDLVFCSSAMHGEVWALEETSMAASVVAGDIADTPTTLAHARGNP